MFTQQKVTVYGQYVVSEYHGDYRDGCDVFYLKDKKAVDTFNSHMLAFYKFCYAQQRLKEGLHCGRASVVSKYSLLGDRIKIGKRLFKQTACYTPETYK